MPAGSAASHHREALRRLHQDPALDIKPMLWSGWHVDTARFDDEGYSGLP